VLTPSNPQHCQSFAPANQIRNPAAFSLVEITLSDEGYDATYEAQPWMTRCLVVGRNIAAHLRGWRSFLGAQNAWARMEGEFSRDLSLRTICRSRCLSVRFLRSWLRRAIGWGTDSFWRDLTLGGSSKDRDEKFEGRGVPLKTHPLGQRR